jgi:hypothetical protein
MNGPWTLIHPKTAVFWRESILGYASSLTEPEQRSSGTVTETARPLLDWASQAADKYDLEARMAAMQRADNNEHARWEATLKEDRKRLTPQEFLTEAAVYYNVISGAAAA